MKTCGRSSIFAGVLALSLAVPLGAVCVVTADAQTSMQRRAERPLVPRSQSRREADRATRPQARAGQPRVYVPGHWAYDRRRGQYSWVAGRWERYDPKHAFVGGGWHYRNGQWTFGPVR